MFFSADFPQKMNSTLNNSTAEDGLWSLSTKETFILWTLCVVSVFAVAEHFAILLLTTLNKTLRQKPFAVSILLLSSSDILLSLALVLFSFINLTSLRQTWICALSYFVLQLGFVSSLVHTLVICTERYLCTRPFRMRIFSVRKRQMLTVINTGICSLILGIPYLFTVRTATVVPCRPLTLFRENVSYALAPSRVIIFLIWICTVIIYVVTFKNFRRRKDRLRGGNSKQNNIFRVKDIHQQTMGVSTSCSNPGFTDIVTRVNRSDKTKTQSRTSNEHVEDNETATQMKGDNYGQNAAFFSEPERRVQPGGSRELHIQDVEREEKRRENTSDMDGIRNLSVEPNTIPPEPLSSKFSDTESSSRSVGLDRQIKSRSSSSIPEVKAFRIVSVVFIVFIVTMTPQSVSGLVLIAFPFSEKIDWVCVILAISSILTNPIMHAFLLKDFRKILRCKY
ncbi:uncharacterized protein [Argopecten irradians]|uniref:uncharacterized protein n=1 Tax=Argopecten irradians TaxID=31199 RepID=UPI0037160E65